MFTQIKYRFGTVFSFIYEYKLVILCSITRWSPSSHTLTLILEISEDKSFVRTNLKFKDPFTFPVNIFDSKRTTVIPISGKEDTSTESDKRILFLT